MIAPSRPNCAGPIAEPSRTGATEAGARERPGSRPRFPPGNQPARDETRIFKERASAAERDESMTRKPPPRRRRWVHFLRSRASKTFAILWFLFHMFGVPVSP